MTAWIRRLLRRRPVLDEREVLDIVRRSEERLVTCTERLAMLAERQVAVLEQMSAAVALARSALRSDIDHGKVSVREP